jgi:hypothetical protein
MAREYFNAYHSYLDSIDPLSDAERGRLFTACLVYSKTGESPDLRGNERFVFAGMKSQIDRDCERYQEMCETYRENAMRRQATANHGKPRQATAHKEMDKEMDTEKEKKRESSADKPRHARGSHGYVKLTDAEYERLIADLGEKELSRVIAYVDESAQISHNKNKWTDWNLVLRKAAREGWGLKSSTGAPKSKSGNVFFELAERGAFDE